VPDTIRHIVLRPLPIVGIATLALLGPATAARGATTAPEIAATTWLNSAPVRLAGSQRGWVARVEFWTFGCYKNARGRSMSLSCHASGALLASEAAVAA